MDPAGLKNVSVLIDDVCFASALMPLPEIQSVVNIGFAITFA